MNVCVGGWGGGCISMWDVEVFKGALGVIHTYRAALEHHVLFHCESAAGWIQSCFLQHFSAIAETLKEKVKKESELI